MKGTITFHRYPVSFLSDVVYGIQPMTTDLAELIRALRRDHQVDYIKLGFYLCVESGERRFFRFRLSPYGTRGAPFERSRSRLEIMDVAARRTQVPNN